MGIEHDPRLMQTLRDAARADRRERRRRQDEQSVPARPVTLDSPDGPVVMFVTDEVR